MWSKYDPAVLASAEGFKRDPQLVWDWYVSRANTIRASVPNAAHVAIAQLAKVVDVTLISQNGDDLHERAGNVDVLKLHGNIFKLKPFQTEDEAFADGRQPILCHACGAYADSESIDEYATKEDFLSIQLCDGLAPHCPACGVLLRPAVVWFGERLDADVLAGAYDAVESCDAMIVVGTSLQVAPASSHPYIAHESGALVIEINPQPSDLQVIAKSIVGNAADVLPILLHEVW